MDEEQKNHPIPVARPLEPPAVVEPLPRRLRVSVQEAWKEASKLAETLLDTLWVPAGGFSVVAFGWLTTLCFFALSIAVVAVVGLGALILFLGLECLALMAYAYPGMLFLISVAGALAPPVVLYWAAHSALGIQSEWSTWVAYPLLLVGAFGTYYYWRFGRVIATTGAGALAFYREAGPKANEIFGAPFAIFSAVWDMVKLVLALFGRVARQLSALLKRRGGADSVAPATRTQAAPDPDKAGPSGTTGND